MKHAIRYVIEINNSEQPYFEYHYSYMNKDVQLCVSENYVLISMVRGTNHSVKKIKSGRAIVLVDALKKAMLVHLILYSRPLQIDTFTVTKNKMRIDIDPACVLRQTVSIVNGDLSPANVYAWKNKDVIETILNTKVADSDSRMAALYAYLCAKSKCYEYERFVNLWIAFNGMYGYMSKLVVKEQHISKRVFEADQLKYMLSATTCGDDHVPRNDSGKIGTAITKLLRTVDVDTITKKSVAAGTDLSDKILNEINSILGRTYGTSAYGYLLVDYAYYFRCNLIHANKPLPLFANSRDHEIKCLRLVNRFLEEYINNNLCLWFNDTYVTSNLIPIAQTITV